MVASKLSSVNEKETLVLKALVESYKSSGDGKGNTDVKVEGFSKMQIGAYVTILSNKGWIVVSKKEKGASTRHFTFTEEATKYISDNFKG